MNRREIRERAGKSQMAVAVAAGVSPPMVRMFEIDPSQLSDLRKRERLERLYQEMAALAPPHSGHAALPPPRRPTAPRAPDSPSLRTPALAGEGPLMPTLLHRPLEGLARPAPARGAPRP